MPAFIALVLLGLLVISRNVVQSEKSPPTRALTPDETAWLSQLVASGREVQAIRDFRKLTGAGLEEASKQVKHLR